MPMASHFNQANHSGKSILARAARLFYSRRGRRTNMILYSLLFIGNTARHPVLSALLA